MNTNHQIIGNENLVYTINCTSATSVDMSVSPAGGKSRNGLTLNINP